MLAGWFSWHPSTVSIVLFVLGWACGWVLLCRPRRLPTGVVVAGQLVSADALIGAMRAIHGSDACVLSDPA